MFFGVGVLCRKLYSFVVYLYVNGSGSITSVGEEPSINYFGDIYRRLRAETSIACDRIWPNFELIRDFMVVFVSCKNEEDPIKKDGARVATTFSHCKFMGNFSANSAVVDRIWPNFELIHGFKVVLVSCKNVEYMIKNEDARLAYHNQ